MIVGVAGRPSPCSLKTVESVAATPP
jgi:hypothetical protein